MSNLLTRYRARACGASRILILLALLHTVAQPQAQPAAGYSLPILDLDGETARQVIVDREAGQYLGHVTTVLLEDGKTMLATYPKGHGKGNIVMKRSTDGGLTWSERLPVPDSWSTSKEVPTLFRTVDQEGRRRLIMHSGLYPLRQALSTDDGKTWTELEPIGEYGGIVACADMERCKDGSYIAMFHDDGRFIGEKFKPTTGNPFFVYQIRSSDGGLTWSDPRVVATHSQAHLCEPGIIRSPDGGTLVVLMRENSRRFNSFMMTSRDEGKTWSEPRQTTAALTGDRHTGAYAPDGRLFVSFRDTTRESKTQGDWVGWVGTFDDILKGREGQYRVRLKDNLHSWDCAYPGLEVLPGGTFVCTTYGHWSEGEQPYILSVRFTLAELDQLQATGARR
ncbi:MAG: glycosyl hydrolase [Planctomycetes bacterium]|nr:glycosyl hydrolase [Planctomycetota bacterium]HJO26261.1 sialidase family protein [Planctomycetota bacterium]